MQFPTFGDVSEQINLEKLMGAAKVRRSQYLKENLRHLLSAIGRASAVLRFVLRSEVIKQARAEAGHRR